jgi:CubicO group peptidase (beta-lactamase class C family)
MKFKNLFTRKKIWIPIIAGITVILLILFFVLSNRNYHSPEDGNAAFYEYPSTAVDSIVEKMNAEARASSLIFLTNGKDSIANLKDVQTSFSGYFYLEQNNCEILNNFEILPTDKKFIRAISEDLLPEFSNDSVMFVSPNLLNTINDSLILSRYYTYQAEQLRLKNVNSLVMQFEIPEKCDSSSENQIVNKLAIKLNILHENKILSIISLRDLPEKISDNNKKFLVEIITKLSKSGLCGIIIYESSQFDLLNETGFDGLIILNIDNGKLPEKETLVKSDILLSSSNAVEENKELTKLIRKSNSKEDLFLKSSKVLRAGLWANQKNESNDSISAGLDIKLLESNITEASITVLKNDKSLIPLTNINQKVHVIFATKTNSNEFIAKLSKYCNNYTISYFDLKSDKSPAYPTGANTLIVVYESGITDSVPTALINHLKDFDKNKIFINLGKIQQGIMDIPAHSIVQVYSSSNTSYSFAAQLIFGGISASGSLATEINDTISYGYGLYTPKIRLKYSLPEDAGLNSEKLKDIDSIVNYAISTGAFPGCQVFVAKNGIVVYEKSFGYLDYSRTNAVDNSDMYDVASLTKICATTLAMMKMVESGRIRLDDKLEKYFKNTKIDYGKIKPDTVTIIDTVMIVGMTSLQIKELALNKDTVYLNDSMLQRKEIFITKTTPSANIFQVPVRALLVHQSGISPSLPILPYMFFEESYAKWKLEEEKKSGNKDAVKKTYPRQEAWNYYYSNKWVKDSAEFKIADNMYLQNRWRDTLWEDVKRLGTFNRSTYQYTDMNMILAQTIIDTVNRKPLDRFVKDEFYNSLGMKNSTFTPLNFNIPRNRIAPTENESFWRRQVVYGNVHDPSAAMLGGISGNAGLFSTASDLGILGQMWLNGGSYGGQRYLNPGTINMFAATQPENHRGLGFDKAASRNLNAPSAPASTYGHTGFTGCVMWVDPENEIVYVFLSNRLHPNVNNWQLLGQKVLQNVHQVIYDAMIE